MNTAVRRQTLAALVFAALLSGVDTASAQGETIVFDSLGDLEGTPAGGPESYDRQLSSRNSIFIGDFITLESTGRLQRLRTTLLNSNSIISGFGEPQAFNTEPLETANVTINFYDGATFDSDPGDFANNTPFRSITRDFMFPGGGLQAGEIATIDFDNLQSEAIDFTSNEIVVLQRINSVTGGSVRFGVGLFGETFIGAQSNAFNYVSGGSQNRLAAIENVGFTVALVSDDVLAGDFDDSGFVDAVDFAVWRDNVGAAEDGSVLSGNGDGGTVTNSDYGLWASAFGEGTTAAVASASTPVPEPATVFLLLAAGLGPMSARPRTPR